MKSGLKRYEGSCHCRRIKFAVNVDLSKGTIKCNCTLCTKLRCWSVIVGPEAFILHEGDEYLVTYKCNSMVEDQVFCRTCGTRPYGIGDSPRWGRFYAISVSCLDNLTSDELSAAPIAYLDGRSDNWTESPADIRNL